MTYYCSDWVPRRENITNGESIQSLWDYSDCGFTAGGTFWLNSEGEVNDSEVDWHDVRCSEHDQRAEDIEHLIDRIVTDLEAANLYLCEDDDCTLDRWESPVCTSIEELRTHEAWHRGEREEPADPPTPTAQVFTPSDCRGNHPAISAEQRQAIATFIRRNGGTDYNNRPIVGVLLRREALADSRSWDPMYTTAQNSADAHIAAYHRDWPHHFWIALNDPHLQGITGRTSHDAWRAA